MRLTKNVFHDTSLFGLTNGQVCSGPKQECHNAGWYNHLGEFLGWGDLDSDDLERLVAELEPGEVFVVIRESEKPENGNHTNYDYVLEHAAIVVTQGAIHVVAKSWFNPDKTTRQLGTLQDVPIINKTQLHVLMNNTAAGFPVKW